MGVGLCAPRGGLSRCAAASRGLMALFVRTTSVSFRQACVVSEKEWPLGPKNNLFAPGVSSSRASGVLQHLPVVPWHPVDRIGRHFRGVALQFGEVVEGV